MAIDLATIADIEGFVIHGEEVGDNSGFSVSAAGDFNNDGFDDLVIGAFRADGGAGATYVVFGRADGFGTVDLANLAAGTGFVIHGEEALDNSGISVSSVGDINGDGFDDIVIGAWQANGPENEPRTLAGASYVVFGHDGPFAAVDLAAVAAGDGGFVIHGANDDDQSGFTAVSAGDINGDGFVDLAIGVLSGNGENNAVEFAGDTYVVFGHAGPFAAVDLADVAAGTVDGFVIHGANAGDNLGSSVSLAGDINGDGIDDLVVGAWRADGAGNASSDAGDTYVVFGHTGAFEPVNLADIPGNVGFVIHGEDPNDNSGVAVSSAGDFNGDGVDDIVIGADLADSSGNARPGAGDTYVVFGQTGAFETVNLASIAGGNGGFVIHGAEAGDDSGISVSFAGDINGDNFDDLIIGAAFADGLGNTRLSAGDTYVLFGHDGPFPAVDLADIAAGMGFVIHGQDAGDGSGLSASAAGDINSDGFDDLIIGAAFADGPGNTRLAAGDTYVLFGSATIGTDVPDAPTVDAGADRTADEGQTVTLTATFTDPDAGDTHTATIDWGDGTIVDAIVAAGQVSGGHAYADNGVYTVTVSVTDNSNLSASDTFIATVNNVAPVADDLSLSASAEGGAQQTFSFSATDAGSADTLSFTLLTSPSEGTVTDNADGTFTFDPGADFEDLRAGETRVVSFTYRASDDDGANSAPATVTITVAGVGASAETPTVDAGADRTANEGQLIALAATITDANAGDTHSARIDWGDGTDVDATVTAGQISGSHAYADNGTYTVTVTVTDSTGLVATDSLLATIDNVAPVAQNLTFSGPAEHGPPQTFAFSATDLASADLLAFTILSSPSEGTVANNGDGTFTFNPGAAFEDLRQGETRAVSFTYRATDDDGADSAAATVTINVAGFGDKTQTIRDTANTQPWSTQVSVFDTADRLVSETITYDDNTKSVTLRDAANTQPWNSQVSMFDAAGRLVSKNINNDDGSKTTTGLDTLNQHDWFDFVAGYGSQQNKIFEDTHYDNGRLVTYGHDVGDHHDWTDFINVYDNLGRKMSEEQTRDDGTHLAWGFDTLDQYDWSTTFATYDSEWHKLSEIKILDDGTTSSWQPPPVLESGADFGRGSFADSILGGGHSDSVAGKVAAIVAGAHSDFDLLR